MAARRLSIVRLLWPHARLLADRRRRDAGPKRATELLEPWPLQVIFD